MNKKEKIKEKKDEMKIVNNNCNNNKGLLKKQKNIFLTIIIVLIIVICILVTMLLTGSGIINMKTKETVVSSKTVEEQSDLKEAISKVYNAVVYIQVESTGSMMSGSQVTAGSGFVYKKNEKDAYILTNNHVISGANKIAVTYIDGSETTASVVGSDEFTDVAVLKVDAKTVLAVAELGDSDSSELGDTVFTVGAPLGKDYMGTITKGIVSGKSRMVEVSLDSGKYLIETLQTDATINSGNSGGPLCNILGQVVGINSSKLVGDGVEGMGFSIPINSVNAIIDKLEKGQTIERPYLGVQLSDISNTFALQYYYNISISKDVTFGAVLSYVEKGKPAYSAGLEVGDVVVEIDGEKVEDASHFRYILYKHNVGDSIKFKYYRGNEMKETTVKLTDKIQ